MNQYKVKINSSVGTSEQYLFANGPSEALSQAWEAVKNVNGGHVIYMGCDVTVATEPAPSSRVTRHDHVSISPADMRLGDVVYMNLSLDPWKVHVVVSVSPDKVILFRPYVHIADFSYVGRQGPNSLDVITMIGTGTWELLRSDKLTNFRLLERRELD